MPATPTDAQAGASIDPHSEYSLYDVLENKVPDNASTEFYGLHLWNDGGDGYRVQPDGHTGSIDTLHASDYDDVLELVADLIELWIEWNNLSMKSRVDRAGRVITHDAEKAKRNPTTHIHADHANRLSEVDA